ncbi:UNVERIFIED_CONTAM: hypothetical protein ABID98_001858 [Brevibacillus sp. OAP136]
MTLEGELFPSFHTLWSVKSGRSVINVETVDWLDEILAKAPFASILIWLIKDPHAHELVIKGKETHRDSHVLIPIQMKRNYRRLHTGQIKSYLVWKLQTCSWIENTSGVKVDSRFCCLSKTIGSDFSPLIEVPSINLHSEPLSTANILSEQVETLLLKLGIGPDLRYFSTDTIYSILLRLPEIDTDGAKARSIYKQIVMSKSKMDQTDSTYLRFMKEGKVLVKQDGDKFYSLASEAYYVENRTFCEDIMRRFPILDLERRCGNQLVKTVLGVQPLVGLRFRLTDKPVFHPLHERFQPDLEEFKPFVYAYRLDKDNKHNELDRIKKLRISLCTEIRASYNHLNQNQAFHVQDYEYITLDKGYHVYLKLPNNEHENIQDLRDDFRFNELIAEIIAGVLRVEENRKDYRELYAKKTVQREELIRRELDDELLEKLQKARTLLGIATDPTYNFWMSLIRAMKAKVAPIAPDNEDSFIRSVASGLKLDPEYLYSIWSELDYEEPGSGHSSQLLIQLFRTIGIDVGDYNTYSMAQVDLTANYRTALDRLKMKYRDAFLSLLFKHLSTATVQEQRRFIEIRDHYAYFEEFDIRNSVAFDARTSFAAFLDEEFEMNITELEAVERIEMQATYFRNLQALSERLQLHNVTQSHIEAYVGIRENGSLLYFGKVTDLVDEYLRLIKPVDYSTGGRFVSGLAPSNGVTGVSTDLYAELFREMQQEAPSSRIKTMKTSRVEKANKSGLKGKVQSSRAIPIPNQATNDEIGFLGEAHVYLALCEEYGKENVEWVSENARRAKVNEYGNDGEKHDIRYTNKRGHLKYVEVKTSAGMDTLFHISKEEIAFGEAKKDAYEVFIVLNVNSEDRTIRRIPGFFKYGREESFNQNPRFNVENRNFVIRFREAVENDQE